MIKYLILFVMLALLVLPPILWRRNAYNSQMDALKQRAKRMAANEKKREASRLLGIRENAKPEEVKRAHLRLMKKYHPDLGGSKNAAARINEAKEILLKAA